MPAQDGLPVPMADVAKGNQTNQNRILKLFLFLEETTTDTFTQKIPLINEELEPLNLKVRPGSNWKMRSSDGTCTHNDGYGLDLIDPLQPVARYLCYRIRHVRLPSGALAKLAFSREMLSTLRLTECCQQAIDKVEAQPGLCMCARRAPRDGSAALAKDTLKRKREAALALIRGKRPTTPA